MRLDGTAEGSNYTHVFKVVNFSRNIGQHTQTSYLVFTSF